MDKTQYSANNWPNTYAVFCDKHPIGYWQIHLFFGEYNPLGYCEDCGQQNVCVQLVPKKYE
jgi:hypothetical protein